MAIKRLQYFNGFFLKEQDFTTEQKYHLDMRRRHNQRLHTKGVVSGLKVTPGPREVSISSGMAIDSEGREIVLEKTENFPVTSKGDIVLSYKEEATDPATETGITGKKRLAELFDISKKANPIGIVLAKIASVSETGNVILEDFQPTMAGPAIGGDLTVKGFLALEKDPQSLKHAVRKGFLDKQLATKVSKSGNQTMAGALIITAGGIGLSVSNKAVISGELRVSKAIAAQGGVVLPSTNPVSDDHATSKKFVEDSVAKAISVTKTEMVGKAGDKMKGPLHIRTSIAPFGLSVDGRVGIGTTNPFQQLHVSGNFALSGSIIQEDWIVVNPLFNGFSLFSAKNNPPSFFRDKQGIVHLRGVVKRSSSTVLINSLAMFALPPGYRPEFSEVHTVLTNETNTGRCDIRAHDGMVLCVRGHSKMFSLDGISFRAKPEKRAAIFDKFRGNTIISGKKAF